MVDLLKHAFGQFLHFVLIFLISLAIVLPIRYFVVQPFLVRGDSMLPTFHNLDYLFVERVSYYFREPLRGESIVFRFPENESDFFIKRIIGLPGERVIIEGNTIRISQKGAGEELVLEEDFGANTVFTGGNVDITLGENEYFVLGDNRAASFDSRRWGPLPEEDIVGRVLFRVWPPARAKAFFSNDYSFDLVPAKTGGSF